MSEIWGDMGRYGEIAILRYGMSEVPYLPTSPDISPHLPISPHISPQVRDERGAGRDRARRRAPPPGAGLSLPSRSTLFS